jgi:hypothetical protein
MVRIAMMAAAHLSMRAVIVMDLRFPSHNPVAQPWYAATLIRLPTHNPTFHFFVGTFGNRQK